MTAQDALMQQITPALLVSEAPPLLTDFSQCLAARPSPSSAAGPKPRAVRLSLQEKQGGRLGVLRVKGRLRFQRE